jgi:hypothetical protein
LDFSGRTIFGLLGVVPLGLSALSPLSFDIEWYDNSGGNPLRERDELQVLYVADEAPKPIFIENVAIRSESVLSIPVPPNLAGKEVHVWLAFRAEDLSAVSTSVYAGSVQIT